MNNLHPVFDDILQSFVAPPAPRPRPMQFEVTVIVDGESRVIQTRAMNAADAIVNATMHFTEARRLTVVARPRG